jgi:hypothetical protein
MNWRPAMTPAAPKRSPEEVARIGQEIFERRVKPLLKPEDDGKYVAIDIATEDYEVDINEWAAIERLTERRRGAQIWLVRINKPYRTSFRIMYGTIV